MHGQGWSHHPSKSSQRLMRRQRAFTCIPVHSHGPMHQGNFSIKCRSKALEGVNMGSLSAQLWCMDLLTSTATTNMEACLGTNCNDKALRTQRSSRCHIWEEYPLQHHYCNLAVHQLKQPCTAYMTAYTASLDSGSNKLLFLRNRHLSPRAVTIARLGDAL